jgi:PRTRC genetic system protein C
MGIRKFVYDGRIWPDPDPGMTSDEVRQNLASMMPELANAETQTTKDGDDTIVTFTKRVGTKG